MRINKSLITQTTGGGSGSGTVTSVALAVTTPTGLSQSVTGSPITTSGTLSLALSFTAGYAIPTTIKQSNWDDAYTWVSGFPTQTGNAGKYLTTNGSILSWASITGSALTKTDDTNVTLTLGGSPTTALLSATSLTLGWTGQLSVGRGGSGASTLTGVLIGNGTSAFTAVSGTAAQVLRRNVGNTAYEFISPPWITLDTLTANSPLAYNNLTGVFSIQVATTSQNGYLSSTDWNTFNGKLSNIFTAVGDMAYGGTSGAYTRLAGNTTAVKQYLSQTGTGTASAAPVWSTLSGNEVTGAALTKTDDTNVTLTLGGSASTSLLRAASLTLGWTGQLSVARGGTGLSALGTANQLIRVNAGATALEFFTPTYLTSAITSLNGLTGATQTFVNDTNVTIVSTGTTHTINWSSTLSPTRGGTGLSTYSNGDLIYGSGTNVLSVLAGNVTTTRKFLRELGTGTVAGVPVWDTLTAADIPGSALTKTDDTNVTLTLGGSPTTALLNAASLTLGWTGTLSIARGGTGASTKTAAFDALTPNTTLGDISYHNGTDEVRLAGNTTAVKQYLSQTGTGTVSAAPAWATISGSDITGAALTKTDDTNVTLTLGGTPTTALLRAASLTLGWTGQLSVARGGTGLSALGTANQLIRVNATATALEYFTPTYLTTAITSLGGLTASTQTFANDTNVTITSATSTHTLGWTGQLAVVRGGTGTSSLNGVVIGNSTSAFTGVVGSANQLLRRNAGNTAYEFFTATYIDNPLTTLGDTLYGAASGVPTRLAGNITTAKQYLSQTGTGTVSAAPAWATIAGADVTGAALTKTDDTNVTLTLGGTPATSLLRAASLTLGWTGQLSVARGGTGLSALGTANQLIRVNAGATALEYFTPSFVTGSGSVNRVPKFTTTTSLGDSNIVDTGTIISVATLQFVTNANIPVAGGTVPTFVSSTTSPDIGRLLIGDGTGWSFYFSKRLASVTTDLFQFRDSGTLNIPVGSLSVGVASASWKLHVEDNQATTVKVANFRNTNAAGFVSIGIDRSGTNRYAMIEHSTAGVTDWWVGTAYGGGGANSNYQIGVGLNTTDSKLAVKTTGQLQLNNYLLTSSFSGTIVGYLAFDASGNILTASSPGGTTQWTTTGSDIYYATGNVMVGSGTSDGIGKLQVSGTLTFTDSVSNNVPAIKFKPKNAFPLSGITKGDLIVSTNGIPYYTPFDLQISAVLTQNFLISSTNYTLTNTTAAQKIFNTTTNGGIMVDALTYFFEVSFDISGMSSTSGTFGFQVGGTATVASVKYEASASKSAITLASPTMSIIKTSSLTALTAATTSTTGFASISGIIRFSTAGSFIPNINISVGIATAVIQSGAYFRITPVGEYTRDTIGYIS